MASLKTDDIDPKPKQKRLFYVMGVLFSVLFVSVWLVWLGKSPHLVVSQSIEDGTVFINGTASIGTTDHDFICATLDWWPPDKCDYGTCS